MRMGSTVDGVMTVATGVCNVPVMSFLTHTFAVATFIAVSSHHGIRVHVAYPRNTDLARLTPGTF